MTQVSVLLAAEQPDVVVAASLGGILALEALSDQPQLACQLVLLAPVIPGLDRSQKFAASGTKSWANTSDFANTRGAIPDTDFASASLAHQAWRDVPNELLRVATQARGFAWRRDLDLLLIGAERDQDIVQVDLENFYQQWTSTSIGRHQLWWEPSSHAGLLLGRNSAVLALRTLTWLHPTT